MQAAQLFGVILASAIAGRNCHISPGSAITMRPCTGVIGGSVHLADGSIPRRALHSDDCSPKASAVSLQRSDPSAQTLFAHGMGIAFFDKSDHFAIETMDALLSTANQSMQGGPYLRGNDGLGSIYLEMECESTVDLRFFSDLGVPTPFSLVGEPMAAHCSWWTSSEPCSEPDESSVGSKDLGPVDPHKLTPRLLPRGDVLDAGSMLFDGPLAATARAARFPTPARHQVWLDIEVLASRNLTVNMPSFYVLNANTRRTSSMPDSGNVAVSHRLGLFPDKPSVVELPDDGYIFEEPTVVDSKSTDSFVESDDAFVRAVSTWMNACYEAREIWTRELLSNSLVPHVVAVPLGLLSFAAASIKGSSRTPAFSTTLTVLLLTLGCPLLVPVAEASALPEAPRPESGAKPLDNGPLQGLEAASARMNQPLDQANLPRQLFVVEGSTAEGHDGLSSTADGTISSSRSRRLQEHNPLEDLLNVDSFRLHSPHDLANAHAERRLQMYEEDNMWLLVLPPLGLTVVVGMLVLLVAHCYQLCAPQEQPLLARWPARPRLYSATGVAALVGLALTLIAIYPLVLEIIAPKDGIRRVSAAFLPLVAPGLMLSLLFVRPSDRSRVTLFSMCAVCVLLLLALCWISLQLGLQKQTYKRHETLENCVLSGIMMCCACRVVWIAAKHGRCCLPGREGGAARLHMAMSPAELELHPEPSPPPFSSTVTADREVKHLRRVRRRAECEPVSLPARPPRHHSRRMGSVKVQMHLALADLWHVVRLGLFTAGLDLVAFSIYRQSDVNWDIRVQRYGYHIHAIVGLIFLAQSAFLTPRHRLLLQLGGGPSTWMQTTQWRRVRTDSSDNSPSHSHSHSHSVPPAVQGSEAAPSTSPTHSSKESLHRIDSLNNSAVSAIQQSTKLSASRSRDATPLGAGGRPLIMPRRTQREPIRPAASSTAPGSAGLRSSLCSRMVGTAGGEMDTFAQAELDAWLGVMDAWLGVMNAPAEGEPRPRAEPAHCLHDSPAGSKLGGSLSGDQLSGSLNDGRGNPVGYIVARGGGAANPAASSDLVADKPAAELGASAPAGGHVCGDFQAVLEAASATPSTAKPPSLPISMRRPCAFGGLELGEALGSGAFGTVYAAYHPASGLRVAAKVFPRRRPCGKRLNRLDEMVAEVRLAMSLSHAHICRTLGTAVVTVPESDSAAAAADAAPTAAPGTSPDAPAPSALAVAAPSASVTVGIPALVMELAEGGTLKQLLFAGGSTPAAPLLLRGRLARELSEAVAYLHGANVLHCDLKPSNVLLTAGPDPSVKLCDMGLAQRLPIDAREQTIGVRGTPRYMAPEVVFRAYSFPADVYSFAICLYELLHSKRFLAAHSPLDGLLTVIVGDRPTAGLRPAEMDALDPREKCFASAAAALIEECWRYAWEDRPTIAQVVGAIAQSLELAELPCPLGYSLSQAITHEASRWAEVRVP